MSKPMKGVTKMADKNMLPPENEAKNKLTYQPFLFVITLAALLVKVAVSLATNGPILDWLFVVIGIFCIMALFVYVWERSSARKAGGTDISISVGGSVNKSHITGLETESTQVGEEHITINTGDIEGSEIIGKRQKNKHPN